jgi:hypothetical protein
VTTLTLSQRIERKQAANLTRQASYHARALAYYRAKGDEARADESEAWLRANLRCRRCGRAISDESAEKYSGLGPDCAVVEGVA